MQNIIKPLTNNNVDASDFKSGYSNVNGLKMYYEIYGNGKPLVLIHGGGSTIQTSFGRIIPFLSMKRKIIAVELQAHGRTGDRDKELSFQQDADDVSKLLENLQIEKADFLGFSNGGQTLIEIALRYPRVVDKIILCSIFYKREGVAAQFWEAMNNATINDMPRQLKDGFLEVNDNKDAFVKMFNRDVRRMQTFKDWKEEDLRSINAPTLLIAGDMDVGSNEHLIEMYRLIRNCELAIIPGEHGKYLGEVTTLTDGKWMQDYVVPLFEKFLDQPNNR